MFASLLVTLFSLSVFTLSLGQLGTLARLGDFKLYVFDLVVTMFALFGTYFFVALKKSFKIGKIYFGLLFLVFWMLITFPLNVTELNDTQIFASVFYLFRFSIYLSAVIVTQNLLLQKFLTKERFFSIIFMSALFISVAGFIQLILVPDFTKLDPLLGLDPHKNRLASTFLDPNFAGGYLSLLISIAIGTYLFKQYKWTTSKVLLFIVIPVVAMFLTFSRSSWAMLSISIFIYGIFRSRTLLVLSLILIFGAYFAIPRVQTRVSGTTDPADSAAYRFVSWRNASVIAQNNLLYGVGFNTYRYAQRDYGFIEAGESGGNSGAGTDSSFLLVLATTGLLGFLLFIFPMLISLVDSFFVSKNLLVFATFMGLILHSQFVNSLFYPPLLFIWPLLLDFPLTKEVD